MLFQHFGNVNLKNKTLHYVTCTKWVYSGIENRNSGQESNNKTLGKSNKQRTGTLFYGEGGESWEGFALKESPLEKIKLSV